MVRELLALDAATHPAEAVSRTIPRIPDSDRHTELMTGPPAPPVPSNPNRPPPVVLFSEYLRRTPQPASIGPIARATNPPTVSGLDERSKNRLVRLFEDTAPAISADAFAHGACATPEGREQMATVVIDRLDKDWADMRFRWPRYRGQTKFEQLTEQLHTGLQEAEILDVAGAWLDAYARLETPWLREAEARYTDGLDEILRGTGAARRDREIVRRSDIGSDPVIEEPLRRFLAEKPGLRPLGDKLHEAQAELDAGNSADAITDVGNGFATPADASRPSRQDARRTDQSSTGCGRVQGN